MTGRLGGQETASRGAWPRREVLKLSAAWVTSLVSSSFCSGCFADSGPVSECYDLTSPINSLTQAEIDERMATEDGRVELKRSLDARIQLHQENLFGYLEVEDKTLSDGVRAKLASNNFEIIRLCTAFFDYRLKYDPSIAAGDVGLITDPDELDRQEIAGTPICNQIVRTDGETFYIPIQTSEAIVESTDFDDMIISFAALWLLQGTLDACGSQECDWLNAQQDFYGASRLSALIWQRLKSKSGFRKEVEGLLTQSSVFKALEDENTGEYPEEDNGVILANIWVQSTRALCLLEQQQPWQARLVDEDTFGRFIEEKLAGLKGIQANIEGLGDSTWQLEWQKFLEEYYSLAKLNDEQLMSFINDPAIAAVLFEAVGRDLREGTTAKNALDLLIRAQIADILQRSFLKKGEYNGQMQIMVEDKSLGDRPTPASTFLASQFQTDIADNFMRSVAAGKTTKLSPWCVAVVPEGGVAYYSEDGKTLIGTLPAGTRLPILKESSPIPAIFGGKRLIKLIGSDGNYYRVYENKVEFFARYSFGVNFIANHLALVLHTVLINISGAGLKPSSASAMDNIALQGWGADNMAKFIGALILKTGNNLVSWPKMFYKWGKSGFKVGIQAFKYLVGTLKIFYWALS